MTEAANKRRAKIHAKVAKAAWMNNEPHFNPLAYTTSLLKNLNFYNTEIDPKDKQAWTLRYWKEEGKNVSSLKRLNAGYFSQTGALVRLIDRGVGLEDNHLGYLESRYKELSLLARKEEKAEIEKVERESNAPKKLSVQDHLRNQASEIIGEIDGIIDDMIISGKPSEDIGKWIKSRHLPAPVVKMITKYFEFSINDIKNPEGYASGRRYSAFKKFYEELEAALQIVKAARIQKPRVKKQKPAGELVKAVKYQVAAEGLTSELPAKIIGAKEVYLFNTDRRKLAQLVAMDGHTLSVKGTTIINIDPEKSTVKTIRKPEVLLECKKMGLRQIRNMYKDIKAVARPAVGRMNEKTIILAIH